MGMLKVLVAGRWMPVGPTSVQSDFISRSGDTMDGPLLLPAGNPPVDNAAARKKYADDRERALAVEATSLSWNDATLPGTWKKLMRGDQNPNGPGTTVYYYLTNYVYGGTVESAMSGHTFDMTQRAVPYAAADSYGIIQRNRIGGTWTAWSSPYASWTGTLTPGTGWVLYSASYPLTLNRTGNTVAAGGLVKPSATTAVNGAVLTAAIPAEFRPAQYRYYGVLAHDGTNYHPYTRIQVHTNGTLIANVTDGAWSCTTTGWISLSVTWTV
jgi:hypothetical protein